MASASVSSWLRCAAGFEVRGSDWAEQDGVKPDYLAFGVTSASVIATGPCAQVPMAAS